MLPHMPRAAMCAASASAALQAAAVHLSWQRSFLHGHAAGQLDMVGAGSMPRMDAPLSSLGWQNPFVVFQQTEHMQHFDGN